MGERERERERERRIDKVETHLLCCIWQQGLDGQGRICEVCRVLDGADAEDGEMNETRPELVHWILSLTRHPLLRPFPTTHTLIV